MFLNSPAKLKRKELNSFVMVLSFFKTLTLILMKTKNKFLLVLSLVLFLLVPGFEGRAQEIPDESEDNDKPMVDSIDFSENLLDSNEIYKKQFDSLSKDGEWVKVKKSDFIRELSEETGEDLIEYYTNETEVIYVWRPYCANSYWNPYSNGCWEFSSYGWTWVSYYSWGWGPYNYGRWYCSNYYGWIWMPGIIWAPNWVTWRCNNYYYGWYPTCPRIYWRGYGNRFCTNNLYSYRPKNWTFVNKKDFTKKIDKSTIVSVSGNAGILKQTQKIKSTTYSDPGIAKIKYIGPEVNEVSKQTGVTITPKQITVSNSNGKDYADKNNNPEPTYINKKENNSESNSKDNRQKREDSNNNNSSPNSTTKPESRRDDNGKQKESSPPPEKKQNGSYNNKGSKDSNSGKQNKQSGNSKQNTGSRKSSKKDSRK